MPCHGITGSDTIEIILVWIYELWNVDEGMNPSAKIENQKKIPIVKS